MEGPNQKEGPPLHLQLRALSCSSHHLKERALETLEGRRNKVYQIHAFWQTLASPTLRCLDAAESL